MRFVSHWGSESDSPAGRAYIRAEQPTSRALMDLLRGRQTLPCYSAANNRRECERSRVPWGRRRDRGPTLSALLERKPHRGVLNASRAELSKLQSSFRFSSERNRVRHAPHYYKPSCGPRGTCSSSPGLLPDIPSHARKWELRR